MSCYYHLPYVQDVGNGENVLTGGYIDLNSSYATAAAATGSGTISADGGALPSTALFEQMKDMVATAGPELVKKIGAVYFWNITVNGKTVTQWSKYSLSL